jgi:hypothetical protein
VREEISARKKALLVKNDAGNLLDDYRRYPRPRPWEGSDGRLPVIPRYRIYRKKDQGLRKTRMGGDREALHLVCNVFYGFSGVVRETPGEILALR